MFFLILKQEVLDYFDHDFSINKKIENAGLFFCLFKLCLQTHHTTLMVKTVLF